MCQTARRRGQAVGLGRLHLIPILTDFLRAYPNIDIRLVLSDSFISLLEETIDVALRVGALPDSSLIALRVGTARRIVCASPAYLAARGTPRTPLAGNDFWAFVRKLAQGRQLIITSDHGYAAIGLFSDATGDAGKWLADAFKGQKAKANSVQKRLSTTSSTFVVRALKSRRASAGQKCAARSCGMYGGFSNFWSTTQRRVFLQLIFR